MMLPPTGTMKFLSVLEMITSTVPTWSALIISLETLEHWSPYAELITWFIPYYLQSVAISTIESYTLGAKHEVVESTHNTLPWYRSSLRIFLISSMFVQSSSPFKRGSITIGLRFAVYIDFKQVFWSMRGKITYSFLYSFVYSHFLSLSPLRVSKLIVIDIPVAKGRIIRSLMFDNPKTFYIIFSVMLRLS